MATFPSIAFERPATEERLKAIGPTNASPPALQRAGHRRFRVAYRSWSAGLARRASRTGKTFVGFGGATEPPGRTATHHLLAAAGKFEPAGWVHAALQEAAEPVSSFVYQSFHELSPGCT